MTWIAEIKDRWARATPGPWLHRGIGGWDGITSESGTHVASLAYNHPPNATAIAAAPTDTARLVRELEEAVELIDALTDGEPCEYDCNGYCKTHALEGPCSNKRALVWLERVAGR